MTMEDSEIRKYLDIYINARVEGVLHPLMDLEGKVKSNDKYNGAAFLALGFDFMALFFCYVEFLGFLYSGGSDQLSQNAVEFIRQYFGRVNPSYKKIGGLLYHVYWHGSVHELKPKTIELESGMILRWEIMGGSGHYSNEGHLAGWQANEAAVLKVDENSLCNDLVAAVELFYEDLCSDQALRGKFENAVRLLKEPEKLGNRSYISESDFGFIRGLPPFVGREIK
jgi:hypothetical protein